MTAWQTPRSRAADAHLRDEARSKDGTHTIRAARVEDDTSEGWQGVVSKHGPFGADVAWTEVFKGSDAYYLALRAADRMRKEIA